ncbi:MAG: HlyD family efflux transporter periplasmic adaptor subunit [Myxococcales bacterium]|nr:HlyD family efflux transporter periplasmic adaptor subunit [Myxococcales bacterium]
MDVPRQRPKLPRRRLAIAAVVALLGTGAGLSLARTPDRRPRVARSRLTLERVRRGALEREVQARGTLVPDQLHWVTATGPASVAEIAVRAGDAVTEGDVLVRLENAELELAALEAERAAAAARTALTTMRSRGRQERLAQAAELARLEGETQAQRVEVATMQALAQKGLAPRKDQLAMTHQAEGQEQRLAFERERREALRRGHAAEAQSAQRELDTLVEVARFRRRQLEALTVTAPTAGTVQELVLEPGQWVTACSLLAKIAKPGQLQVEMEVPESSASDLAVGQAVAVTVIQATVAGRVARIDPTVTAGTVRVEVTLEGDVPEGARADLAVSGVIALERIDDTLVIPRPSGAVPRSTGRVLVYDEPRGEARSVAVSFGRASVREIEVLRGLSEGDRVIIAGVEDIEGDEGIVVEDE